MLRFLSSKQFLRQQQSWQHCGSFASARAAVSQGCRVAQVRCGSKAEVNQNLCRLDAVFVICRVHQSVGVASFVARTHAGSNRLTRFVLPEWMFSAKVAACAQRTLRYLAPSSGPYRGLRLGSDLARCYETQCCRVTRKVLLNFRVPTSRCIGWLVASDALFGSLFRPGASRLVIRLYSLKSRFAQSYLAKPVPPEELV